MENSNNLLEMFVSGDYFIVFLVLILIILVVLIMALVKTRIQYLEVINDENRKPKEININDKVTKNNLNKVEAIEENDILDDLEKLIAKEEEEIIDKNQPLETQINIPKIKTYDDVINEYESTEEEEAVISAEELERKTKERTDSLGLNDNQVAIQKYEEEQERKAIISYEQLVKNASNISLTYKEEKIGNGAPKVNKIEILEKEVTPPENYLKEEEFLNILKEFRLSLE